MSNELHPHTPESVNALTNAEKRRLRQTFGAKNLEKEILHLCSRLHQAMQTEPYDMALCCDIMDTINRLSLRYGNYTRGSTPSPVLAAGIEAVLCQFVRFFHEKVLPDFANILSPLAEES